MNDLAYTSTPLEGQAAQGEPVNQPASPEPTAPARSVPQVELSSRARPIPHINIQAFCEAERTAQVLADAAQDRRLSNAHTTVHMGGIQTALMFYKDASTPNLVILESTSECDIMIAELDRFAEVCDAATKVVVIGHVNDILLYRQLIARGVSDYLVMPLDVMQIMECLSNLYNDANTAPVGQIIAFIGAKGGCGSSTVCHNTAWEIAETIQSEVVIADFDLPFGTAGLDFNQDPVQGIQDALSAPERVDEVLLDRLLSRCSERLSLFAAPGTLEHTYDLNAESCELVIDTVRRTIPFVTVDIPHMWTSWAQSLVRQADNIVITAGPDLANLRNAKNIVDKIRADRSNDCPPLLVLNQVGLPKRPEISANEFSNALEIEATAVIEFDAKLFGTAANNGQMVEEVSAKSVASRQFRELAYLLTDRSKPKLESKSVLAGILDKFRLKKLGL